MLVIVLFGISIALFTPEYSGADETVCKRFYPAHEAAFILSLPPLVAKDLIDLYRSGSAVGQTLFSFLVPLAVMWFFLAASHRVPPRSWAPVPVRDSHRRDCIDHVYLAHRIRYLRCIRMPPGRRPILITSKIIGFSVLQIIPAIFISFVAVMSGEALYLCLLSCSASRSRSTDSG